jgi:hypothetical protein
VRLPASEHLAQPWRIHELVPDFRLEDVWEVPVDLDVDDFPRIVAAMAEQHPEQTAGPVVAVLLKVRRALGSLFGWDDAGQGVGARVASLRDRLPADLRDGPRGPEANGFPFEPLYLRSNEFAAEMANSTVQGVMHLGLVETSPGIHRGRMAVLVKPNGRIGRLYMAAIKPIRYGVVYPLMLRAMAKRWDQVRHTS